MLKFLLDENLSQETADFLNSLGNDVKTVAQLRLAGAQDEKVAEKATRTGRILITLDLDFGEMYYFGSTGTVGVVVLRLRDQRVESVNATLQRLLHSRLLAKKTNRSALIIIDESKVRIRKRV